MDFELKCEDYLQNMTPIAQKMAEDIVRVKGQSKNDWDKLTHKGKCQMLDKTLIDFKLAEEYKNGSENENNFNRGSLSQFSWFSKSQLDLFKHIDVKPKYVSPKKHEAKEKTRALKKGDDEKTRQKGHVAKPKNPPPPPPPKRTQPSNPSYDDISPGDSLPKTGFDFLDNW